MEAVERWPSLLLEERRRRHLEGAWIRERLAPQIQERLARLNQLPAKS